MKKLGKVLLIILASLVVLAGAFIVYVNIGPSSVDVSHLSAKMQAMDPKAVKVDNVKLFTQPDAFTCGVTTISVVMSFLQGADVTPETLIDRYHLLNGMTGEKFAEIISQELPDYTAAYKISLSDEELLVKIHDQLAQGIPVPVFFGAENPYNKPKYDFHASVVTGLDLEKQQVHIMNVYGYEEDITLTEFMNRMAYRGGNYPFVQKAVVKLGLQKKNCLIALVKK